MCIEVYKTTYDSNRKYEGTLCKLQIDHIYISKFFDQKNCTAKILILPQTATHSGLMHDSMPKMNNG